MCFRAAEPDRRGAPRPASATAAWTPNGSGSVVSTLTPVVRQRLQRVEVGLAGLGVLRRHRAAADVSLRHDDRLADLNAPAEPLVLLVLAQAVDAEVHPEPATVDLVDAGGPRDRAQGSGAQQGGRTAAHAVGGRPGRADEPQAPPGEVGDRLAPRPVENPDGNGHAPELRVERAVDGDLLGDGRAVREREREQVGLVVPGRDDLLEDAEALAVHEPVVLVHQEERAIARDAGLGQLALVRAVEARDP